MAVMANDALEFGVFFFFEEVDIYISDALWQLIGFLAVRHNISQYSAREKQKRRFCVTYLCFPLASVFHSSFLHCCLLCDELFLATLAALYIHMGRTE